MTRIFVVFLMISHFLSLAQAISCYNTTRYGATLDDELPDDADIVSGCDACTRARVETSQPMQMVTVIWGCSSKSDECTKIVTLAEKTGMKQSHCQCCDELCNGPSGCQLNGGIFGGVPRLTTPSESEPKPTPSAHTLTQRCISAIRDVNAICGWLVDEAPNPRNRTAPAITSNLNEALKRRTKKESGFIAAVPTFSKHYRERLHSSYRHPIPRPPGYIF